MGRESDRDSKRMWILLAGMVLSGMIRCSAGERKIVVGGKQGWVQGFNYSYWAASHSFYVSDWLLFVFDKRYYDVLEVNETSYEKCNVEGYITNITQGGRDVFQLKQARPYYFICSKGYCYGGMKLAVDVVKPPSAALPPVTEKSSGFPLLFSRFQGFVIVVCLVFAMLIII